MAHVFGSLLRQNFRCGRMPNSRVENVGSGLVDRHGAGIGDRVSLLLADVQLKGLKMQFTLAHDKILISVFTL